MKKLFAVILCLASLCQAQSRYKGVMLYDQVTVTFSATPTFDASKANVFKLTLTGNVTSSTLSNALTGQDLIFELCQDGTGGRTFVAPANVLGFLAISSTASACTTQEFIFDGTNAQPLTATASAINGVIFPASPATHSVPVVTAANTTTWKVVPDCTDTTGNHINYTQSTDVWSCGTSVPANVVTTATLASPPAIGGTAPNTGKFTTLTGTGDTQVKRIKGNQATALVTGDVGTLTGWGTTASVSAVLGTDGAGSIVIASAGTGQTINPTFVLTFHDGTWTNSPIVVATRTDVSGPAATWQVTSVTATAVTFQFNNGTPAAGASYSLNFIAIGR